MTVATFSVSNYSTDTGTAYPLKIDGNWAVMQRIAQAFAPHAAASPNMTVVVDAGSMYTVSTHTLLASAQQATSTITAPVTHPRIDRIVITISTGAVAIIAGVEATSPVAPAFTSTVIPVAQVLLQTTSTSITNSMITDERVPYIL